MRLYSAFEVTLLYKTQKEKAEMFNWRDETEIY